MEEPEAHAFPFYTKYSAELIALDDSNLYFITTHNPYFLLTLIEKTPKKDLAVYNTYYDGYQTKAKKLSEKKLQEVLDLGHIFQLGRFDGGVMNAIWRCAVRWVQDRFTSRH